VAQSYGLANLRAGDEILLTEMEHHSNIVPWQQVAERTGAVIRWAPIDDRFELDLDAFDKLLTSRTKIVAVTAISNVLGTINPLAKIIAKAHAHGAVVLVDAAQAAPHEPLDVQTLDCDFLAFSGHKMLGPTGIGVLYGKSALLEQMPPFLGGGSMIHQVTKQGFTPADLPHKFEAGTPPIVQAIGLGAAVEYLEQFGLPQIMQHERQLVRRAHQLLPGIPGLRILGPDPEHKGGIVTFVLDKVHPDDLSRLLDVQGIAVRAGHHCAMPLHARLGLSASCRASFYLYNRLDEVETLADEHPTTLRPLVLGRSRATGRASERKKQSIALTVRVAAQEAGCLLSKRVCLARCRLFGLLSAGNCDFEGFLVRNPHQFTGLSADSAVSRPRHAGTGMRIAI
jgi:cysteine desulfurase/selenocysteine lyase